MTSLQSPSACRYAVIVLVITIGATPGRAATPPLTLQQLQSQSDTIVIGKVSGIRTRTTSDGEFVDEEFFINVAVNEVLKGNVRQGQNVAVKTWRPKQRPAGFTGPQGQNVIPKVGDVVRVFCRGTVSFQFRRSGNGQETAHVILEPNGLAVRGMMPDSLVGEWKSKVRQDNTMTVTKTLNIFADGRFTEANMVEKEIDGQRTASSSISQGRAERNGDKIRLGDRVLMLLRDGRLLTENEFGAQVYKPANRQGPAPDPGFGPNDPPPITPPAPSRAQQFARFADMTIEELPNGDLKVLSVTPGGGASQKGIRAGHVIFQWTFENQNGSSSWSASFR